MKVLVNGYVTVEDGKEVFHLADTSMRPKCKCNLDGAKEIKSAHLYSEDGGFTVGPWWDEQRVELCKKSYAELQKTMKSLLTWVEGGLSDAS